MSSSARKLLDDALRLSPKARLGLATRLIQSVEVPGEPIGRDEWDAAWAKELDRRWARAERSGNWGAPLAGKGRGKSAPRARRTTA